MKKYIAPTVEILDVQAEVVLALSSIYNEQSTSIQLSNEAGADSYGDWEF